MSCFEGREKVLFRQGAGHTGHTYIRMGEKLVRIRQPGRNDELGALDYLLKPFGRDRLDRVLQRAQAALEGRSVSLLSRAKEALQPTRALSRVFVRDGNRIVPIALASIERVQGADDYATIFTSPKQYLVSIP